jgi:hypothetical protein
VLYQLISRPGEQNYGMAMATSALLILLAFLTILLISAPKARTLTKTSQLISRGELG